ncbi:MAG: hypothetical protein ACOX1Q_04785 [Eubacteriales bacterium]|jgi:hypothetical protein
MNRKALLLSLVVTLVTVTVLTFGLRQHKNEDTNSPADRLEIYEKYKDLYETYQFNPASFDWGYPALDDRIRNMDFCAVVEVAVGMEEGKSFEVSWEELWGDENLDEMEQWRKDGLSIENIAYKPYTVKVIDYVYNKTMIDASELTVIYGALTQAWELKAVTGMKLLMFFLDSQYPDKVYGGTLWTYYITEDGYIIPASIGGDEENYAGMKLDEFVEIVREKCHSSIE